jgi:CBS domain-containing protein
MSSTHAYPPTAEIFPNIPARDLLAQKPQKLHCIDAEDTVYRAIELMAGAQVGALLVLRNGQLVGIISERDYARKVILVGRSSQTTKVEQIMSTPVVTVSPDESLQGCMQIMTARKFRHLPVVESGQPVGMLSIGDVVRETLAQQRHALNELQRYVNGEPRSTAQEPSPRPWT